MTDVVLTFCLYCNKQIQKGRKYCSSSCGHSYRKYKLNIVDFKKFDLSRRIKPCEICNNLFIDNSNTLTRLHCSISCQNHKYYYNDRENQIQRAKEYRLLYPERVKAINSKSRAKYRERHKEYMKAWHNVRKSLEKYNS